VRPVPVQAAPAAPAAAPDKVAYSEAEADPSGPGRLDGVLCQTPPALSETRSCSGLNSAPARVAFSPRTERAQSRGSIPTQSAPASQERSYACFRAYRTIRPVSRKTCRVCVFICYFRAFNREIRSALLVRPTTWSFTSPDLKNSIVGILRIPKRFERAGLLSTSTFVI